MSGIINATDAIFKEEVIQSAKPVLVDFWAEWCVPCKKIAPILEELSNEYGEKIKVVKMDIDLYPDTASAYKVMSIPTILLFEGGEIVKTIVGGASKAKLVSELAEYLQ